MNYPTRTILEYSFAAFRVNGDYVKITNMYENQYSNKDLILRTLKENFWTPPEGTAFEPLTVTDEDRQALERASQFMRRYSLLSLGNLTKFQEEVYRAYCAEETPENKIGILAYFPMFAQRELEQKEFRQVLKNEYKDSKFVDEKQFTLELKILKTIYLQMYDKNMHIAGSGGNLYSFFIDKKIPVDTTVKVKARNSGHDKERDTGYAITKLNYVKILKG